MTHLAELDIVDGSYRDNYLLQEYRDGSPLLCEVDGRTVVGGLLIDGKPCDHQSGAVFTKNSNYVRWIHKTMARYGPKH